MRIDFVHDGPHSLRLGLIVARGVRPDAPVPALEEALHGCLKERSGGLDHAQDAYRSEVRGVFRNGRYKPTGRGKPASEYLLRSASEDRFPRINTLVDSCNYLSLASLLPISIWDLERASRHAGATNPDALSFRFRLGMVDESYVFNAGGQKVGLEDLIVGAVVDRTGSMGSSLPIVNAIKDCQATKTTPETSLVAAAVYAPLHDGPDLSLDGLCSAFCSLLAATHPDCRCATAILEQGQRVSLEP